MLQEKKINIKLIGFMFIVVVLTTLLFCNIQDAHADVYDSDNQLILGDYEDEANKDRLDRTKDPDNDTCEILMQESSSSYCSNVWHVTKKSDLTSCSGYRTIHTYIDGQDYPFDYHIRGYFGDRSNVYGRKAHVQFFYNEETQTLRVLCFGNNIGYDYCTYQYNSGTSILEDELKIYSNARETANRAIDAGEPSCLHRYTLANEIKHIEIDPRLQEIKKRGFQNSPKLIDVDVIGQRYDLSQLRHISSYAFRNCAEQSEYTYHGAHYIKFQLFNIYDRKKAQFTWDGDYAAGSLTHYYPQ
ncbi:MAG: hypothetical protein Q4E88_01685 [Coriobacteriia bacterium]|nr:hypothetical protein [Coriobacteriia bacterium]